MPAKVPSAEMIRQAYQGAERRRSATVAEMEGGWGLTPFLEDANFASVAAREGFP